ncbi:hypothetical protein ACFV1D_34145, partial [Streptomyces mirabilis]
MPRQPPKSTGTSVRFGTAAGNRETGGAVLPHADASARRARALWHPTIMLIRDSIPEAPHDLYPVGDPSAPRAVGGVPERDAVPDPGSGSGT